jgi:mono/diheme cytochrome c family protein
MAPIARNLTHAPVDDVRAISDYIASVQGKPSRARRKTADELIARLEQAAGKTSGAGPQSTPSGAGASIFAGSCAGCHSETGAHSPAGARNLALSTPVHLKNPGNAIRIVLGGVSPTEAESGSRMPSFASALTDKQIADLLSYVRSHFSSEPTWNDLEKEVPGIRQQEKKS